MSKEFSFISLFEQFIKDSANGKRVKPDGQKIKPQTVDNYRYVLALLQQFVNDKQFALRICTVNTSNQRKLKAELSYWKKFYRQFTDYLSREKECFDNYIGMVFKIIRVFFNYLKTDKLMPIGEYHKQFYVRKEDIPVITLMPDQLQYLIHNKEFERSLKPTLRKTKDVFVFGCTVALRYSDLMNLRFRDIVSVNGQAYLVCKSIKVGNVTRVKLPAYALDIVTKNKISANASQKIFKGVCVSQFNKNLRQLTELAGWVELVGKSRKQDGKEVEQFLADTKKPYRFCDLVTSHVMRRTAITTMLMYGMPEYIVRKISGHSASSRAFYRYVNLVQPYLDQEIDKVHERLEAA